MIPIFDTEPTNWKDLQIKVAKIFSDLGYETSIEKDIQLVRGEVNVDVFAIKRSVATHNVQIAECKYWTTAVPKSVVHSVRTILSDFGANTGYIISRCGFQSGAYDASENSNLFLLTFEEFQNEFRTEWISKVVDDLEIIGNPLRKFTNPLSTFYETEYNEFDQTKKDKFHELFNNFKTIAMYSAKFFYKDPTTGQLDLEDFEFGITKLISELPKELNITCLMDYFDYYKQVCNYGVNQFDELFGMKLRKYS